MKAFAFVLLCALAAAAVQGRHTGFQSTRSAAALGENPWLVHLRIAVATSGLLETCAGSLIDNRWVLTAASCVVNSRFIWVRFGVVKVVNPSLVVESNVVRVHPDYNAATNDNNVALIDITRFVETTDNIAPINPAGQSGESGKVCTFGGPDGPGESLNCYSVEVSDEEGKLSVSSDDLEVTKYDIGSALVSNGAQVGLLADESGNFIATAKYAAWLTEVTGVVFKPEAVPEVAPEAVHFV